MFSWPDPHQTLVQCPGSHITTVNIFAFYIHFQCCVLKSKRWMLIALLKILVLLKCNGKMLFVVCLTIPLIKDLVYTVNINDFLHVPFSVEKINHNALNWKKKQTKQKKLTDSPFLLQWQTWHDVWTHVQGLYDTPSRRSWGWCF